MKKLLALVLATVLVFALFTACAPKAEEPAEEPEEEVSADEPADEPVVEEPAEDPEEEGGQPFDPLGAHFAGVWTGKDSTRVMMNIKGDGTTPYEVVVSWSDSAFAYYQWEGTAEHVITDEGSSRLVMKDGVKYMVTFVDETTIETVTEGTNLEFNFDYASENGKETVTWDYDKETPDSCVFVKESAEIVNPITKVSMFTAEMEEEGGQPFDPLGAHFAGVWFDDISSRASMNIEGDGTEPFKIVVSWSNSAFEYYQWEMTATHRITEDGTSQLYTTDCVKYSVTMVDDENAEVEILGKDLEFTFDYATAADGTETITWEYDKENGGVCEFFRNSYEITSPIIKVAEMKTAK